MTKIHDNIETAFRIIHEEGLEQLVSRSYDHFRIGERVVSPLLSHFYIDKDRLVTREELPDAANRVFPFGQPETVEMSSTGDTGEYKPSIDRAIGTYSFRQPVVCEFIDAMLMGEDAVAVTADERYILENSRGSSQELAISLGRSFPLWAVQRPQETVNCAISLVGGVKGFYHWFVDYLPKLQGLKRYEEATNRSPALIIPSDPPRWMRKSLELLGYWNQTVEWSGGKMSVERLIVPTAGHEPRGVAARDSRDYILSPSRLDWLRKQFKRRSTAADDNYLSDHIYISRSDAVERRVLNEYALINALPDEVDRYVLSDLSLSEQIHLFSNAETVVAPHGAGLTNILWGTELQIMELWGVKDTACYFIMSEALGHDYTSVKTDTSDYDIIANVDRVVDIYERMLEKNTKQG